MQLRFLFKLFLLFYIRFNTASGKAMHATLGENIYLLGGYYVSIPQAVRPCMQQRWKEKWERKDYKVSIPQAVRPCMQLNKNAGY